MPFTPYPLCCPSPPTLSPALHLPSLHLPLTFTKPVEKTLRAGGLAVPLFMYINTVVHIVEISVSLIPLCVAPLPALPTEGWYKEEYLRECVPLNGPPCLPLFHVSSCLALSGPDERLTPWCAPSRPVRSTSLP